MTDPYAQIPGQRDQIQPAAVGQFPAAVDEDVPWARQSSNREPATTRSRQLVRSLPDWDPLPPGEILVQRHRRD
ncbi:MAG TPA: hypothetical protein VK659_09370 [Asanoa sp.]|nr:hypothetical protein [Asanoa sp.]